MTKEPINITIKKGSKAAEIFQAAMDQKDDFRRAVDQINAARNSKEKQPSLARPS